MTTEEANAAIKAGLTISDIAAIKAPNYLMLKPNDAVALLNETLAAEADRFTRDTGLKIAAIKIKRDKESEDYRLECHVCS